MLTDTMFLDFKAPFKIAIDGCGDLATRTILPHLDLPDARQKIQVVALCDIAPNRARDLARQFDVPAYFTDYQTLLRESDAEAVLVVVPPHLHGAHGVLAARSGRYVYVQKPLASSLQEADELLDAVAQNRVKLVAAPGQALWPLFQQVRALVEAGEIGPPYSALAPFIGWGGHEVHHGSDPSWCFGRGSGPLRDHGVYGLQTLTTLLGPVRSLQSFSRINEATRVWQNRPIAVTESDNTALLLDFHCGAFGMLAEAWCSGADASAVFRIHGLEGSIHGASDFAGYHGIFPRRCVVHRNNRAPRTIEIPLESVPFLQNGHLELPNPHIYADICHLADCARRNTEPLASGAQARHTVEILETALKNRTGAAITSSFAANF